MAFEELRTRLADVVAIPVTPFDNHGSVDDAGYARILLRMSEIGINVVTPNGNTSEYYSLTEDEAKHAVDLTVAELSGLLGGAAEPSGAELAERFKFRTTHSTDDAPPVLGGELSAPPPARMRSGAP